MNGYYFVLTEYENGRKSYSAKRYRTKQGAERRAAITKLKPGVTAARVKYQAGQTAVDIKKFI